MKKDTRIIICSRVGGCWTRTELLPCALPQISVDFTVREYVQQNHQVLISRSNVSFVTKINAVLKYTV
jgi:hypothetical protein